MIPSVTKHDCNEELHRMSLRATPARLGVLEALEHSEMPVDSAAVIEYLRRRRVRADTATVFRILQTFIKKGIVRSVQFQEGKLRYEYADKPKHHHFICDECGDVFDVTSCNVASTEKVLEKSKGVKVRRHSLEFFGLCRNCTESRI